MGGTFELACVLPESLLAGLDATRKQYPCSDALHTVFAVLREDAVRITAFDALPEDLPADAAGQDRRLDT